MNPFVLATLSYIALCTAVALGLAFPNAAATVLRGFAYLVASVFVWCVAYGLWLLVLERRNQK